MQKNGRNTFTSHYPSAYTLVRATFLNIKILYLSKPCKKSQCKKNFLLHIISSLMEHNLWSPLVIREINVNGSFALEPTIAAP